MEQSLYNNDNKMTTQQKAVFVTEIGKPVQLGKRNIPEPGKHQVLIRVGACMSKYYDHYLLATLLKYLSPSP